MNRKSSGVELLCIFTRRNSGKLHVNLFNRDNIFPSIDCVYSSDACFANVLSPSLPVMSLKTNGVECTKPRGRPCILSFQFNLGWPCRKSLHYCIECKHAQTSTFFTKKHFFVQLSRSISSGFTGEKCVKNSVAKVDKKCHFI